MMQQAFTVVAALFLSSAAAFVPISATGVARATLQVAKATYISADDDNDFFMQELRSSYLPELTDEYDDDLLGQVERVRAVVPKRKSLKDKAPSFAKTAYVPTAKKTYNKKAQLTKADIFDQYYLDDEE
eukprot:13016-Heterococcus_DN1.PRE.2